MTWNELLPLLPSSNICTAWRHMTGTILRLYPYYSITCQAFSNVTPQHVTSGVDTKIAKGSRPTPNPQLPPPPRRATSGRNLSQRSDQRQKSKATNRQDQRPARQETLCCEKIIIDNNIIIIIDSDSLDQLKSKLSWHVMQTNTLY